MFRGDTPIQETVPYLTAMFRGDTPIQETVPYLTAKNPRQRRTYHMGKFYITVTPFLLCAISTTPIQETAPYLTAKNQGSDEHITVTPRCPRTATLFDGSATVQYAPITWENFISPLVLAVHRREAQRFWGEQER